MKKYKGYIAVDFDAVLSSYVRPFKFDSLGKPQQAVIDALQYFYDTGYHINIFTARICTTKMQNWLKKYHVPYHGFNCQPLHHNTASNKPFYDVIIDDKAINYHWKHNKKTSYDLIREMQEVIKWSKEGKE